MHYKRTLLLLPLLTSCGMFEPKKDFSVTAKFHNDSKYAMHAAVSMRESSFEDACTNTSKSKEKDLQPGESTELSVKLSCKYKPSSEASANLDLSSDADKFPLRFGAATFELSEGILQEGDMVAWKIDDAAINEGTVPAKDYSPIYDIEENVPEGRKIITEESVDEQPVRFSQSQLQVLLWDELDAQTLKVGVAKDLIKNIPEGAMEEEGYVFLDAPLQAPKHYSSDFSVQGKSSYNVTCNDELCVNN